MRHRVGRDFEIADGEFLPAFDDPCACGAMSIASSMACVPCVSQTEQRALLASCATPRP
jgi:hypothetical protein